MKTVKVPAKFYTDNGEWFAVADPGQGTVHFYDNEEPDKEIFGVPYAVAIDMAAILVAAAKDGGYKVTRGKDRK